MESGRAGYRLLTLQLALAGLVLAGTIALPPHEGAMLIVPLAAAASGVTATWAMECDAAILASGPVAGSLIVFGRRDRLAVVALRHFSLLIVAPAAFCGASSRRTTT
ncbi:hypothetical protein SFC76_16575 [Sphingomonas sp. CD22]|uniref:hypothetical protein n=1 Tax=Sphingomonas sp. CD22 TaxID=3100214 RepID=UPI002ADFFC40|nr:hypothetical protein [Sphingomonas sp. CD22]MEA1085882.1 hypothetical protein [Sphingomonas sp. CD22]